MKSKMLMICLLVISAVAVNAQWAIDSTNTAGTGMYAASTSTRAVFSNGTEWNIFDATTGAHTYGNLTISRAMIQVVSYGDKVYFGGGKYGYFADPQYTKTVNVYDNATNTWSVLNLGTNREVGGAGAAGGKIVFAGGTGRTDIAGPVYMYNKVDIFDAVTGARTSAKISKGRSNIACGASGNKIVFAGGWYWDMMYNVLPANTVDIYDASTNTWTKTTLSSKRQDIGVAVVGNKIIFAGGQGNTGVTNKVDVYDVSTNTWVTSLMPTARYAMRSAVIGTNAYFAGNGVTVDNSVAVYNSLTNTWSSIYMPTTLQYFSMSVINNKLYFAGGTVPGTSTYSNLVQVYDPATNTWSNLNLSIARTGVAAATVGLKGFFAGGTIVYGYPVATATKRVDIYTAPPRMGDAVNETVSMNIELYPNPATTQININTDNSNFPIRIEVYDLTGQLVNDFNIDNTSNAIDISRLEVGTYILIATDPANNRVVKKFIKQ